jgi:hypothetical protein
MGSVGGSHGGVVVAGNGGTCGAWDFLFLSFSEMFVQRK